MAAETESASLDKPPLTIPASGEVSSYHWASFIFLRCLGLIFLSAFYSLLRQIHGLIGPHGILPTASYLAMVTEAYPRARFWFAPTFLWLSSSDLALSLLVWVGIVASLAITFNLAPRISIAVAWLCFLSFVTATQVFSSYQSDGMLLEAGIISLFLAPGGLRPRVSDAAPLSSAAQWMLRWEWFRIYFESGVVKLASGEPQWRNFTAMDKYYENGPLPTWIGWYTQQLPHSFHALTVVVTLVTELFIAWMVFFPKKFRIVCFFIVTALQIGIIATANYAFLNYLVLVLGILLVDDDFLARFRMPRPLVRVGAIHPAARNAGLSFLGWILVATITIFFASALPLPLLAPAIALQPFRVASSYGLFAVMTRQRNEIEFQGTIDGRHWTPYRFRYKPQNINEAPGIYAPYQPRFEWNLWFASLDDWRQNDWVVATSARLLDGEPSVLTLFRADPFQGKKPVAVRSILFRYWFTDRPTHTSTGAWWNREEIGAYGPMVRRGADGRAEAGP
ncbi:MAG TPA: lipase maturation factor family protein [Thermoanaerobaculia bacterium]|nr:lipase maturation factor family protein [Thermoanaerobaculia bacterium]